ncbi:unnamed protein product [Brassica rapa subsp. trilocularis]
MAAMPKQFVLRSYSPILPVSLPIRFLVADAQSLLEEKEALSEKLAIREYEFRLAQEDITRLKTEGHHFRLQHCPPLSGVEGSLESHLRVLGERER